MDAKTLEEVPACAGCGKCCHLVVELSVDDRCVPEDLVIERDGIPFMDQRMNGACVALDPLTQLCSIYDDRPQVCREFERGGSLCVRTLRRSLGASRGADTPVR